MGVPLFDSLIGRPLGARYSFLGSTPSRSYTVATRSSIDVGLSLGSEAVESEDPYACPPLIPAPASSTENTRGQWSLPALALIFGVRPNSPDTTTSVEDRSPRPARSSSRPRTPYQIREAG